MSDISAVNNVSGPRLEPTHRPAGREAGETAIVRGDDQVELSDTARYLQRLREVPPVRQELIDRIKVEIQDGTYETPEKFAQALDALLDDVSELG